MPAVQDADLRLFVRLHVRRDRCADLLQLRSRTEELVLNDPLDEIFRRDGHIVGASEQLARLLRVFDPRFRRYPVDHGARETDFAIDPPRQITVAPRIQIGPQAAAQHLAVFPDVVAAQYRKRSCAGFPPSAQSISQECIDRRFRSAGKLLLNDGIVQIQAPCVVEIVAAFGDGDRRQMRRRPRQQRFRPVRSPGPILECDVRPNESMPRFAGGCNGFQDVAVFCGRLREAFGFRRPQIYRCDAPAEIVRGLHEGVEIHGLVGAVESAESQVDDPDLAFSAIIVGRLQAAENRSVHACRPFRPFPFAVNSCLAVSLYAVGVVPFILRNCLLKFERFWNPTSKQILATCSSVE